MLLYVNVFTSALLLGVLWQAPVSRFARFDKALGDLSYPTYLLHWQAGVLVVLLTGLALKSLAAFALSVGVVLLLSMAEQRLISRPVEKLRRAVKGAQRATTAGPLAEPVTGASVAVRETTG